MNFRSQRKVLSAFNFVSLADIVLLLVIFFLLSSTFIVQPGIKVKLPRAKTTEAESEPHIVVTLTRDGPVYLGEESVEWEELAPKIYQRLLDDPHQLIVLRADREVPLERAVDVLDMAKGAGGERFLIATQPRE